MNLYGKHKLSPQEIRVCDLLLKGMTYQEIADLMCRAYKTVYTYKQRAFIKMRVRNVAELFILRINAMLDGFPDTKTEWHIGYREALERVLTT